MSKIKMPATRTIHHLYRKLGPDAAGHVMNRIILEKETYRQAMARLAKMFRKLDRDPTW